MVYFEQHFWMTQFLMGYLWPYVLDEKKLKAKYTQTHDLRFSFYHFIYWTDEKLSFKRIDQKYMRLLTPFILFTIFNLMLLSLRFGWPILLGSGLYYAVSKALESKKISSRLP